LLLFAYHFAISCSIRTNEVAMESLIWVLLGREKVLKIHYDLIEKINYVKKQPCMISSTLDDHAGIRLNKSAKSVVKKLQESFFRKTKIMFFFQFLRKNGILRPPILRLSALKPSSSLISWGLMKSCGVKKNAFYNFLFKKLFFSMTSSCIFTPRQREVL